MTELITTALNEITTIAVIGGGIALAGSIAYIAERMKGTYDGLPFIAKRKKATDYIGDATPPPTKPLKKGNHLKAQSDAIDRSWERWK